MMKRRRPDYGLKEGLQITAHDVRSGQSWPVALSPGELRATAMPSEQLIGEVAERMRNPALVRGVGGVGLELAAIGPSDAEKVIFVCYGWGGIGTAELQQYVLRDHTHSVVTIPQVLAQLYNVGLGGA